MDTQTLSTEKLVTKDSLRAAFDEKVHNGGVRVLEPVGMSQTLIGSDIKRVNTDDLTDSEFSAIADQRDAVGYQPGFRIVGKYGTPYDIPRKWSDGSTQSVRERIRGGRLQLPEDRDPQMSTNTLPPDWQNLWEATRLDLSIRKESMPTIRQFIYQERSVPNASRKLPISELFPYGVVFQKNNGEGQAVPQGETRGGQYDEVSFQIYAAGFTWTLLAELFDQSLDMSELTEAVARGFNAKRDDNAIAPILNHSFGSAGSADHTPASSATGANRQELLYLTLQDALDDLSERVDPVTGRKISVGGAVALTSEKDSGHVAEVAQGLPSANERRYGPISEIRRVLGYDGETIPLRDRTVTYDGVAEGTAYLIVQNRYMVIPIKRGLQVEIDPQPDVKRLKRQERAYWFCESIYHEGLQYFVQKVTLPAW